MGADRICPSRRGATAAGSTETHAAVCRAVRSISGEEPHHARPQLRLRGGQLRATRTTRQHAAAHHAFVASSNAGRWLADLYQLARIRLAACGVQAVYGGGLCTLTDARFYSYRREPVTGRFASLVWLTE